MTIEYRILYRLSPDTRPSLVASAFFDAFRRNTGTPDSTSKESMVDFPRLCLEEATMRTEKETLLKNELRSLAIRTRDRLDLTQREMAERLEMNENSYSDIETGVYMCGTLTAILLLLEQEDPHTFLLALDEAFAKQYEGLLLS